MVIEHIFLKEEHLLVDVSAMMSSELRRHCTPISFFKAVLLTGSHSFMYRLVMVVRALTPWIMAPILFFDGTCYKTQSQKNLSSNQITRENYDDIII